MAIRTVSAARALPPDLLRQLSDALGGGACCLWVPARQNLNKAARNRYILQLAEEGYSSLDIAGRLFISQRTVWRVLAKARAGGLSSDPAAGRDRQ
jgi:DNA-binding NarL/FixJ family response regulator